MKIDTSTIEGYDAMSPEQKLAALEGLEIADPDYSGYVKKDVFDKTASDLAKLKKDNLARLSEEERAKQEREEELERLRKRNEELEQASIIAKYKAQYLRMGWDDELATSAANALASKDCDKVIASTEAFIQSHDKALKAGLFGEMKTPPAGSGVKTFTRDEIMQVKDTTERQRLIREHPELF